MWCPSGSRGWAVNPVAFADVGSNPTHITVVEREEWSGQSVKLLKRVRLPSITLVLWYGFAAEFKKWT